MAVNSSEECQNAHIVVVLPDGGTTNMPHKPLQGPNPMTVEVCLNSETSLQNISNLKLDRVNSYAPATCILDVDVEKGKAEIPKSYEESVCNLKNDDSFTRTLHRENCLHIGGNFVHLFTTHLPELLKFASRDKFMTEKVFDTPTNRSRKYKRSPSFNSRRVVLLFSVLSSMGTIILIYLTLRVRQIAEAASGNV